MKEVRTPASQPVARTRVVTLAWASPVVGSTVRVVPRASLLWKPCPYER